MSTRSLKSLLQTLEDEVMEISLIWVTSWIWMSKQEVERQKQEDGSFISVTYTDRNGRDQVLV